MTDGHRQDWQPLLDELTARRTRARAMGGAAKLAARRTPSRLDARARVAELCDTGSFRELGLLAGLDGAPADGFVAGSGTIQGRPVLVGAEDVTVAGGSIGVAGATKRARLCQLARQHGTPLVLILEGAGHRATNALTPQRPAPNDLQAMVDLAGVVPVVVVVAGPSAGHSALAAPLADHVIMVEGSGCLFSAGPPLVAAATGERIDKQQLGGVATHAVRSGLVHEVAAGAEPAGVLIALDRQERGQGERSAAQEVTADYGIPVIAITRLDDVLAYAGEQPALAAEHARLRAYRERYGVAG